MRSSSAAMWMWVVIASCGDDDGGPSIPEECGTEEPIDATSLEEVGKLASISFQEREDDGTPRARVANANFFDFSEFDADAAPTLNFDICSAVVGDQVVRVEPTVLDSPEGASITVGSETSDFAEVAQGRLQVDDLPTLAAGTVVAVSVTAGAGDAQFPSFDAEAEAPEAPAALSNEYLEDGSLRMHWTPSGADAIEIEMWVTNPEEDFHPVRCVVRDDGCLTVNSAAGVHLFQGVEPLPLDIRVSSVRSVQWEGPDGEIGFFKIERRRDLAYEP